MGVDFKPPPTDGDNMRSDKIEISGLAVLFIGVVLLLFAFFNAYAFLTGQLEIPGSQGIVEAFGEAIAPLIVACIRVLYLGIMGWIGSILTVRGIQLLKMEKHPPSEARQKSNPTTRHVNTERKRAGT